MKKWNVTVTPEFGDDIRGIHSYISYTLLEPTIAKNVVDQILKAVGELSELPLHFPVYEKEPWQSRGLRKISVGNFMVFYLTNEETSAVIVLHVFYAGRNIEKCLDDLISANQS